MESNRLKWPITTEEALKVNIEELRWILKGYEVRINSKFKPVKAIIIIIRVNRFFPLKASVFKGFML